MVAGFQAEKILVSDHFVPLIDDIESLARAPKNKIFAPNRVTKDRRKQTRHADGAFSLGLLVQAASASADVLPMATHGRRRFRTIRL